MSSIRSEECESNPESQVAAGALAARPPAGVGGGRAPLGWKARMLLAFSVIWLAPTVACGSFAPRPTPTPSPPATAILPPLAGAATTEAPAVATSFVVQDSATPTAALVVTDTTPVEGAAPPAAPAPAGGAILTAGQPARVTAPNGLNMRSAPTSAGTLILQLATGQKVTLLEGPTQAEGYTWWKVDSGDGQSGWVAQGDQETAWLSAQIGAPQAVNRSPRVGERVIISADLSVRATPGSDATLLTRIGPNTQMTVLAGPQSASGLNWYQVRSDDGTVEGWVAEGDGESRWVSPME